MIRSVILSLFGATLLFSQPPAASFVRALEAGDLKSAADLWKADSPWFVRNREELRKTFAVAKIRVTAPYATAVDGDTAATQLEVGVAAGRLTQRIEWTLSDGGWRVWRFGPPEGQLADRLVAAPTPNDRDALFNGSPRLVTPDLVRLLADEGYYQARNARFDEGLRIGDIAFECAARVGLPGALGLAWLRRSWTLMVRSDYGNAMDAAAASLSSYRKARDRSGQAFAEMAAASVLIRQYRYGQALAVLRSAQALVRASGDRAADALCQRQLGEIRRLHGDLAGAGLLFRSSSNEAHALADNAAEADSNVNIANVLYDKGDYAGAIRLYDSALATYRDISDMTGEAATLTDKASSQDAANQRADAARNYAASLSLSRRLGDPFGETRTLIDLALIAYENRAPDAATLLDDALTRARRLPDKGLESLALNGIGLLQLDDGKYDRARNSFVQSASLDTAIGNVIGQTRSWGNAAVADKMTGDLDGALALFRKMLPVFQHRGMTPDVSTTLNNIGVVYQTKALTNRGFLVPAIASFRQSMAFKKAAGDKPGWLATSSNLAGLYLMQKKFSLALKTANEVLAQKPDASLAASSSAISAFALRFLGRNEEAANAYRGVIAKAHDAGAPLVAAAAYAGLGMMAASGRRFAEAAEQCANGIREIESTRSMIGNPALQIGFFAQFIGPYECRVNALAEQGLYSEALRAAEAAKARALLEMLERTGTDIHKGLTADEEQRASASDRLFNSMNLGAGQSSTLTGLQAFAAALAVQSRDIAHRDLYDAHPGLRLQRGEPVPLSDGQLASLMPKGDAAILVYFVGESYSWVFVLRPSGRQGKPRITGHCLNTTRAVLESHVANLATWISKQGDERNESRVLYDLLLRPAEGDLEGVSILGIVPHGPLWQVPFAALRNPRNRFLIERTAVFYAPSLTALNEMDKIRAVREPGSAFPQTAMLIANPTTTLHPRLPASEDEVNAISEVLPRHPVPLLRREPTIERIERDNGAVGILHLAAGARFDRDNEMNSEVFLASGADSAGGWSARDILKQDLAADLVTVSGCDSARGRIFEGEGVIGLSWAFFVAGTPSTLLAQWRVADESTAKLMPDFYLLWKNALSKNPTVAKAIGLQRAQLCLIRSRKYRHPYFWAPFALIGAP